MTPLESLKARLSITGSEEDCLLMLYLEDARAFILGYTARKTLPLQLYSLWSRIAAGMYRRRDMEGEGRAVYGDITHVAETLPMDMLKLLNSWRLGRMLSFVR